MFREVRILKAGRKLFALPILAIAAALIFPSALNAGESEAVQTSIVKNEEKLLIPGGSAIGVTLESDGILVLGTGNVTGKDRHIYSPAENVLKEGDIILKADGITLDDKEALASAVKNCGDSLKLTVIRRDSVMDISLSPVKCLEDGSNKIGVWVRDSTQGIGTLTYIDPSDSSFGALGHGVYDADTGDLMTVKSGNVVESDITGIKKSEKGSPGELTGVLNKSNVLGEISKNTECGIYGTLNSDTVSGLYNEPIPAAASNEIKTGAATILSSSKNGEVDEYAINIEAVNLSHSEADKGLVIRITDDRLKNSAGGIVQGMSGSPIIQNGKLIGAVTHVFVREPDKGYGIFIENMLENDV